MKPILIVTGLKSETGHEADPSLHPLAHLLATSGGDALVEGDRAGEGSIITDLSCRFAEASRGGPVRDELGDAILASRYLATPPWRIRSPSISSAAWRAPPATRDSA